MPITIADAPTFVSINRQDLAVRLETFTAPLTSALMHHGVAHSELREPSHAVAGKLADITSRLTTGLEIGASDQDMQNDFLNLALYEDAASHWLSRKTRWDAEGKICGHAGTPEGHV